MEKVNKIKVLDCGRKGILIEFVEPAIKNGESVIDEKTIKRPMPLPSSIKDSINRTKIYYLKLTGHWLNEWDAFVKDMSNSISFEEDMPAIARTLIDNTRINGIKNNNNGFVISGFVNTLGLKGCAINTPLVTENDVDEYEYYDEVHDLIIEIFNDVKEHAIATKVEMPDAKQFCIDFGKEIKDETKREIYMDELEEMTEEDQTAKMKRVLEATGCIVLDPNEQEEVVEDKKSVEEVADVIDEQREGTTVEEITSDDSNFEEKKESKGKVVKMETVLGKVDTPARSKKTGTDDKDSDPDF